MQNSIDSAVAVSISIALLASVGVHNVVQGVEGDDQADPIESLEKRRGFVYSVDSGMWLS